MAQYSADIRVGITGKTQLNALERQLDRINKDLVRINKGLKAQTLTINTKGANRALDQLDRKINKLNRSINVNANINERRRSSGGGGGSSASSVAFAISPSALAAAKQTKPIAEALTDEAQKQLDLGKERERQIGRLQNNFEEILKTRTQIGKLAKQQATLQAKADNPKTGKNATAAAMFGAGTNQAQGLKKVNAELVKARKYLDVLEDTQIDINNRVVDASRAQGQYNAKLRQGAEFQERSAAAAADARKQLQKFGQGAFAGGGVAAASALGQVPVLGGAVTGGLVGGLTAGPAGAAGGAIAGGLSDATSQLAAFSAQATKTATDINRLNKSLELAAGADFAQSLLVIRRVVDDFNTPLTDATEQFTKLFASAQGSGLELGELEDLFVGLSAANKAFAGDTEDLNGILRAFTQIISKGTVQSEELKGQVGERLPGAFALAAESLDMTTVQLQEALEKGEVNSAEFVRKFGQYMLQFDEKAQTIADSPVEAGARLQKAITDLENEVGGDLASLGADFQDLATLIITEFIPVAKDLIQFAKDLKAVLTPLKDLAVGLGEAMSNAGIGLGDFLQQVILAIPMVRELYLGVKGLVEIGKMLGIGAEPKGIYGGLPADYKQTELAMFARAERFRKNQKDKLNPKLDEDDGDARESRAPQLRLQYQLAQAINDVEMSTLGVFGQQREQLELMNGIQAAELEYQTRLQEIALEELYPEERKYEIALAEEELRKRLIELKDEELQLVQDQAVAAKDAMRPLEDQRAILEATLNGGPEAAERVKLEQQARDIAAESTQLTQEEVLAFLLGNRELQKRIDLLEKQKETLEQIQGQINQAIGQAIEDVLVKGIAAAVSEAESLSDVLSDIGRQLLSTVGRILINSAISSAAGPGGLFGPKGLPGYRAEGGPINAGMPYIVGEKGPELVVPNSSGTVVPNDYFAAATAALSSGGGASAVGAEFEQGLLGSSSSTTNNAQYNSYYGGMSSAQRQAFDIAAGARVSNTETNRRTAEMTSIREYEERVMNNPSALRVDYESTVINNQTYVTEEQFQKGMTQSANRARQATIRDLRNNPASRKMAGVNK